MQLTKQDLVRIKDANINRNNLDNAGKITADEEFDKACDEAFSKYELLCFNNREWLDSYDFIRDYEHVVGFKMEDYFQKCTGVHNTKDPEFRTYDYEYDEDLHLTYIDAYEHRDEYTQKANDKIKIFNQKRFMFGKKKKIEQELDKLKDIEFKAKNYEYWLTREREKQEYVKDRTTEYHFEKERHARVDLELATKAVYATLKVNPVLASKEHTYTMTSSFVKNGSRYFINNYNVSNVCNTARLEALGLKFKENNQESELSR